MRRTSVNVALSRKNAWTLLPSGIRRAVGPLLALLPQERLLGRRFRAARQFVTDAQWWPAERAREYQLRRVQELCARAHAQSAFYQRKFREIGFEPGDLRSLEDVRRLPFLERDDIRAHTDELLTVSRLSPTLDAVSTGGTSGIPLHFFIGADRSDIEYAYLTAGWERAGFDLRQPLAVFKGDVVPEDRHGLRHDYDPILRRHRYSTFHLSDANIQRYLAHIASIGPCHVLAYPSVIAALARFVRRSGAPVPSNIRSVIAESEIVYEDQRAVAEQILGRRFFALYGLTEKVVAAAECEHTADYHVWPTYGYFELLDEAGQPVRQPGQRGEVVGTSFLNSAMPFIRYRTGDSAMYVAERCDACRREHVLIREIRGHRTQESLVARDGSLIPWSALNMHDDTFLRVVRFQFLQDTPGRSLLRIMPGEGFSSADRERVLRNLNRKLEGRVELTLETVASLPLTTRGKAIYVDQRIAPPPGSDARIA